MAFGYEFVTLNDEQKHARRVLLEWYPFVAQLSVLAVFALFQVAYFFSWIINYGLDHERPKSPSFKKHGEGLAGWLRKLRQNFEKLRWWMKKDIKNWGTRGEWIFGGLWTAWLLYLSIVKTDNGMNFLPYLSYLETKQQSNLHQIICISLSDLALLELPSYLSIICWPCDLHTRQSRSLHDSPMKS